MTNSEGVAAQGSYPGKVFVPDVQLHRSWRTLTEFVQRFAHSFPGQKPFYEAGSCQEEFRELIGSPFYSSFHSWLAT